MKKNVFRSKVRFISTVFFLALVLLTAPWPKIKKGGIIGGEILLTALPAADFTDDSAAGLSTGQETGRVIDLSWIVRTRPFVVSGYAALFLALIAVLIWMLIRRKELYARSKELTEANQKLFAEIEKRRAAQEALKKSEQKYRDLIENINEIVFSTDEKGSMTYISPTVKTAGGYDPSDIVGRPFTQFVFGEDRLQVLGYFDKLKMGPAEPNECRVLTKSGEVRWVHLSCRPFFSDGIFAGVQGTFSDITDRKWIEEILYDSEQKFRRIVEESPDGIVIVDNRGVIVEWNRGVEKIFGINRDEAIGRHVWDVQFSSLPPERRTQDTYDRFKDGILSLLLSGDSSLLNTIFENEILRPDGERRIVQSTHFLIHTDKGYMVGSFTRDVTEQKRAEEQIRISLNEKEVLLKEVHHRVKNNLQVISSLLDVSRLKTENGVSRDTLTEARNKVYTMALIHSQLYASERADRIDMAHYVHELAAHIGKMYVSKQFDVTPILAIEKIHLTVNQAIPCALVLNELITNAYKHAFKARTEGAIIITMKRSGEGSISMEVKDNGVGLPESVLTEGTDTLGLRLVTSIVQDQLKGKLEMESDGGLSVRVTFKEGGAEKGQ